MPPRRQRDRPRRLQTLQNDLELLVICPATATAGFDNPQPRFRSVRSSTLFSTTMPPTSIRTSAPGSIGTHVSSSTSHQPRAPGSIRRGVFAKLSRRRSKRGVFHSVVDLQAAIDQRRPEALHIDCQPRQNHRQRQKRAAIVRFHPLDSVKFWPVLIFNEVQKSLTTNNGT